MYIAAKHLSSTQTSRLRQLQFLQALAAFEFWYTVAQYYRLEFVNEI